MSETSESASDDRVADARRAEVTDHAAESKQHKRPFSEVLTHPQALSARTRGWLLPPAPRGTGDRSVSRPGVALVRKPVDIAFLESALTQVQQDLA